MVKQSYSGKSTGKGGLSLWMHNLESTSVIEQYKSSHYSGSAIRVGAGVLAADAYLAAQKSGLRVVSGGCPSVGFAGGFTQGGGQSLLSSRYGMSADNVLEWEVVTAAGDHLVVSPSEHEDLYWALSGGGGGTFGVVLSMTVKAHPDGSVTGAYLSFNSSSVGSDVFWEAVDLFHASLPTIVDAGATAVYQITDGMFVLQALTAPDLTKTKAVELLSPLLAGLNKRQIPFEFVPTVFDNFYDHFDKWWGPLPYGPYVSSPGSNVGNILLAPNILAAWFYAHDWPTYSSLNCHRTTREGQSRIAQYLRGYRFLSRFPSPQRQPILFRCSSKCCFARMAVCPA